MQVLIKVEVFMNIQILKNFFNKLKYNRISFSDAQEKQEDFLKKLNEVKIGNKNDEQKK